jgi:ADP-dependent NAD(P)H-hydrate dehydratase / NAD(P)H-hydrate epimerase
MIPVLSREQIRAFDRHVIDAGVPGLLLMENAGRGAAEIVSRSAFARGRRVIIVAGPGNNGGDGFVVARRLRTVADVELMCFLTSPAAALRGDARVNHDAWLAVGGLVVEDAAHAGRERLFRALGAADVVVDALFGTGLDRNVAGDLAGVIEAMNACGAHRVALDIPSGLCADTGRVLGVAVQAHETATFAYLKKGLLTPRGVEHAGEVHVVDIGVPRSLVEPVGWAAELVEASDVAAAWLPRPRGAHKVSSGRVLVLAGSPGKTGAALLVARGALRAGAGLVTLAAPGETARALDRRVIEAMTLAFERDRFEDDLAPALGAADVVVVGPGLGLDAQAQRLVDHVVFRSETPAVLDADALTHLSGRLRELSSRPGLLLTPHPGEMGRLLGEPTVSIEQDRFAAVTRAVSESHATVLLKGARTVIGTPGRVPAVNPTGSPVLATGGSGDVLSGICGAVLAAVRDPFQAACAAAYVHGRAAERWAESRGADRGMLAREIADGVPDALGELSRPLSC